MNKILLAKDLKCKFPLLSVNAINFELAGKQVACTTKVFEMKQDVEEFVNDNKGKIVIFDQPNFNPPEIMPRDGDKYVLRYALLS